jgi:hypothetical protein
MADWMSWKEGLPSSTGVPEPELDENAYEQAGIDPERVGDLREKIRQDYSLVGDSF